MRVDGRMLERARPDVRSTRPKRSRRRGSLLGTAVGLVVMALVVAACQIPTSGRPDEHGLRASFRIGAFDLTWNATAAEYDVEMLPPGGGWSSLGRIGGTMTSVTDLTAPGRYQFRVRDVIDGTPGSWSPL